MIQGSLVIDTSDDLVLHLHDWLKPCRPATLSLMQIHRLFLCSRINIANWDFDDAKHSSVGQPTKPWNIMLVPRFYWYPNLLVAIQSIGGDY